MVEVTRDTDEVLNYAIIRLIVRRFLFSCGYCVFRLTGHLHKVALNEQFMVSAVHGTAALAHPTIMATSPVATSPIAILRSDGQPRNHHRAHSNSHPPLPTSSFASYSSATAATQREVIDREAKETEEQSKRDNRVLSVLMRRLGHSKTFGENIIFMLNRSRKWDLDTNVNKLTSFLL